jgi:cation transport regulator
MPYASVDQLPLPVREHLPKPAQNVWLKAFNNAHEEYGDEATAARVAWAAVKKTYHKSPAGHWVKN